MSADYSDLLREISEKLGDAVFEGEEDLRKRGLTVDEIVLGITRRIGQQVTRRVYDQISDETEQESKARGLGVEERETIGVTTIFGSIPVKVPYLRNRKNGETARPMVREIGLSHGCKTPAVVRALTDFGAEESFGQASVRFEEHYGFNVGRTSILRVVETEAARAETYVASRLDEAIRQYEELPPAQRPGTEHLLVELDGCEIRTGTLHEAKGTATSSVRKLPKRTRKTAWRDVRIGFARPTDATVARTFVGRMDPYPVVVKQLFGAACDRGLSERTQVSAVIDGGNGLREELETQFSGLNVVLDRCHLKQHLYEAAQAQGLKTKADKAAWVRPITNALDQGKAAEVIASLAEHKGRGKTRVLRLVKHLTRFSDAMHYQAVRDAGLPQGDGEVESAHRYIPQKRLKLPGAWWRPDHVNPMLALRVIRANGWWNDFWDQRIV